MFDYQEGLKEIELEVIPKKISSMYEKLEKLMTEIYKSFSLISVYDSQSFYSAKKARSSNSSYQVLLEQYEGINRNEEKLLAKERELEKKITSNEKITEKELEILEDCKNKKSLLEKNKLAILKNMIGDKRAFDKRDASRMDYESNIEEIRKEVSEKISELTSLVEEIDNENLGKDRLDGLSVEKRHVDKLNKHIEDYSEKHDQAEYSDYVVNTIDDLFKNSMEIKIELYKQLYDCATQMISEYKKHNEMDYSKLEAINNLMNSRITKIYSEIYPYYYTDRDLRDNRHFSVLTDVISGVNGAVKGEISEDGIDDLKQMIHEEDLEIDMKHNYIGGREADISQSLAYYKELMSKKHRVSK